MPSIPDPSSALGPVMHHLIADLFPICRSITGDGVRQTLRALRAIAPLELREVPSGTPVFDWTVPDEWNVREAYIAEASTGRRIIDFKNHSLHLVSYSIPIRQRMTFAQLKPHLHSLPAQPDLIPYRTSYYKPTWGFCLSHHQLQSLPDVEYEVVIDSTLSPGHLTYGEHFLPGESTDEFLFSAHCCHPSLANDNLSGIVLQAFLARELARRPSRRHSFRFVWAPGTIGAIAWLARNEQSAARITHGLILSCLGDGRAFTYKRSRQGNAPIDRAVEEALQSAPAPARLIDFSPYGYDERQYCSPGFNLPVGLLMNSQYGQFPEYHTSADDLTLVRPDALADSLAMILNIIDRIENSPADATSSNILTPPANSIPSLLADSPADTHRIYLNLNPKCEPQLGRRGLYATVGGQTHPREFELAMLWVLNQSDGLNSIADVAARAKLPIDIIRAAANALLDHHLLCEVTP